MGMQNKLRMVLVGASLLAGGAVPAQDIVSGDEAKARKYAGCMPRCLPSGESRGCLPVVSVSAVSLPSAPLR